MATKIYLNWEEDSVNWESEIRLWEEVYDLISDLLDQSQSGARNPVEWGDAPYDSKYYEDLQIREIRDQLQRNLDRLTEDNKQKLIEVLILMGDERIKTDKFTKKNIKIRIEDIKTIANDYLGLKCEILNVSSSFSQQEKQIIEFNLI